MRNHHDSEWEAIPFGGRAAHVAGPLFARCAGPHRNPYRLRHFTMWRLYRTPQWQFCEGLYSAGRTGGRQRGDHDRRTGPRRKPAPDPGGVLGETWLAVRLLHPRHDYGLVPTAQEP